MDRKPVKIYSSEDVPRLRYIAGIILGDILGLSWELVTDKRKLGKHTVINYSSENIPGCFKISPDGLLFETGIKPRGITVTVWNGLPVFFQTNSASDLPFDILAASFYLISRYEEYIDIEADQFEQFKASSSLAFKNGFLGRPVVELWVKELAKALLRKFQTLTFRRNEFRALMTIDVDQPFAYLGRNILSSLGGMFRDLTTSEGHPAERYRSIISGESDPYEVFDYITDSIERQNADTRFFFSVGDHSKFDKNPSWKNDEYRKLIHRISKKYKAGLHASFNASRNPSMICTERARLRAIIEKDITINRFHCIRFSIPGSFINLGDAGITEDYSMGYPDVPGFRAGIARPFYFYNLSEDQQSLLKVIPFQLMDSSLGCSEKLDPAGAKEIILDLINETRQAGGTFVSIWHNTSLLNTSAWKGWREVFEFMLKTQIQ